MSDQWRQMIDREQYLTVDGTDVHYYDEGEGNPLLLMHGGGLTSCAELNWGAVIDPLSEFCRVLAIDQPGFGFTDPRGERDYQPSQRADFAAAFLEELGVEGVSVAGNSRAGFQALYMALEYPDLIDKVIVVNAGSASRKLAPNEVPGDLSTAEEPTRESVIEYLDDWRASGLVAPENHPLFDPEPSDAAIDRILEIQRRNWEFTNGRHEAVQTSADALNDALSYDGEHVTESAPDVYQSALITWSTMPYEGWPRQEDEPETDAAKKFVEVHPETLPPYRRDEGFDMGVHLFERMPNAEIHIWHDAKHHVMTDHANRWSAVVGQFVAD